MRYPAHVSSDLQQEMLFENADPQDTSLAGDLCKGSDGFCPVKKSPKVDMIVF